MSDDNSKTKRSLSPSWMTGGKGKTFTGLISIERGKGLSLAVKSRDLAPGFLMYKISHQGLGNRASKIWVRDLAITNAAVEYGGRSSKWQPGAILEQRVQRDIVRIAVPKKPSSFRCVVTHESPDLFSGGVWVSNLWSVCGSYTNTSG